MASNSMRPSAALRCSLTLVLVAFALAAAESPANDETNEPGWLGFRFTYEEATGSTGTEAHRAFLHVQEVLSESPAEKGRLEKGDRVLVIDGQPVSRFTEEAVLDFFLAVRRGQRVDLGVDRLGVRVELEVEAVKVPERYREVRERLLRLRRGAAGSDSEPEAEPPAPDS